VGYTVGNNIASSPPHPITAAQDGGRPDQLAAINITCVPGCSVNGTFEPKWLEPHYIYYITCVTLLT